MQTDVIDSLKQGLKGLFEISFTDAKSCIAFSSAGWENTVPQEWFIPCDGCMGGYLSTGYTMIFDPFGAGGTVKTQVSMNDIVEGYKECETNIDNCRFKLEIREDF